MAVTNWIKQLRRRYAASTVAPRVEYEISELGRSLAPLFHSLSEWAVHLPEVEAARVAYDARTEVRAEKGY